MDVVSHVDDGGYVALYTYIYLWIYYDIAIIIISSQSSLSFWFNDSVISVVAVPPFIHSTKCIPLESGKTNTCSPGGGWPMIMNDNDDDGGLVRLLYTSSSASSASSCLIMRYLEEHCLFSSFPLLLLYLPLFSFSLVCWYKEFFLFWSLLLSLSPSFGKSSFPCLVWCH